MKRITTTNIERRLLRLAVMAFALPLAAFLFTACSDDDDIVKTPLSATSITEGAKTVSTLNFSWQPVEGATQYAYELREKATETIILGGTTNTNTLLATNLKPNTAYEMSVWAYAALSSDKTTSSKITITATTNEVVPLATPSDITSEWGAGTITITWPAVENAQGYEYQYEKNGETVSGVTADNSLTIAGLPVGEYTVYLRAVSDDENFSDSESIAFTFKREKAEIWRTPCSYYSGLFDETFSCDIVAYDDGNYEIAGLYGSDKALEFNADEYGELLVINAYKVNSPYTYVDAGDYRLCLYIASGYSGVECSRTSGYVWYYAYIYDNAGNYLGDGYDEVTWGGEDEPTDALAFLVGDYTETTSCQDILNGVDWVSVTGQTSDVKIEKVDDTTVSLYNLYGLGDTLTGTVDIASRTITFSLKEDFYGYYTFCQYDEPETPVVATIADDGTISINNWTLWYGPYNYSYIYGAESVLVKK